MKISFSELLQRYLLSIGINKMYGIVGREADALSFNELEGFDFILTRHEMTAGIMATAISRFTKGPQFCFATLGPGLTNYMNALATAALDRYPLILIVAQLETPFIIYNDAHQCVDNVSIAKPLSKYAYEMKNTNELKFILEVAIKASMTFPFGPAVISIPIDILSSDVEIDSTVAISLDKNVLIPTVFTDLDIDNLVKEAADLIKLSKNPLIVVGDAVVKTDGVAEKIRNFSEKTNIPVIETYSAKGIMKNNSKLNLGVLSSYIDSVVEYKANEIIYDNVDTMIFIGYDLCERHPFLWSNNNVPKTFININSYNNNAHRVLKPKVNIISPLYKSIDLLKSYLGNYTNENNADISEINKRIEKLLTDKEHYRDGITHPQIMNCLNNHFNNSYILANDIGMHRHLSSIFFRNDKPENFVTSEGLSSFGTGLSLGMGSKIANPKMPVVVIAGDGGFHSNDGDIETTVRLGLKILIVVLNSSSNALIERYQLNGKNKRINKKNTSFGKVDFTMIAKANGCQSGKASNINEFNELLKRFDEADGPFLIEVPIYYPQHYINAFSK